jgi:hypothetical protein
MKTEARKSFRHGFNLTEQELRRIVDTISQQFSRVAPSAQLKFEAKLRNGTLVESSSVDDVLSFENVDSRQIVRLELDVRDSEPSPKWLVHIQFANSKDDDGADKSIRYTVRGDDRGWVFVTSSELDERVARVKCFAWSQIPRGAYFFVFPLIAFAPLIWMMHSLSRSNHAADIIEKGWSAGTLRDPIQAMIISLRASEGVEQSMQWSLLSGAVYTVGAVLFAFVLWRGLGYLYPSFSFSWGDYLKVYEKRLSTRKYVFAVVLTGLVLSIIAGIIVNRTGWGR